jgi:FtsH-binding integral membrane protein
MSYGLEYSPIAARAEASERATFIRKTYLHLAGAILIFAALETFLVNLPQAQEIVRTMFFGAGRLSWLIVLGAFIGVSWLANTWARSDTSPALQYLGLTLYVAAEAVIFLPLLYIANSQPVFAEQHVIRSAGILTLTIFAGLTTAVFVTRRDFSYLRTYLVIGGWIALGLIVASIFIGFNLGLIFCFAIVALACGYIVYDTSNIMYHYRTDQHVAASLALFASVALLFYYILMILMRTSRR